MLQLFSRATVDNRTMKSRTFIDSIMTVVADNDKTLSVHPPIWVRTNAIIPKPVLLTK